MSIKERLVSDMKEAMKSQEKLKLSVIRMTRASIKNTEIDKKHDLSDDEVVEVLAKEVKQRRDSIEEYANAGRQDTVEQLNQEIAILMDYLPEQLAEDEIRALVKEAVEATGAGSVKEMGKVMGVLMPKVKGKADGKLVNQIVREFLQS